MDHNVWASYDQTKGKWQSISIEACIPREQLGYIYENAVIGNEGLCLDIKKGTCTFEMFPHIEA